MTDTILDTIVRTKRAEVAAASRARPIAELQDALTGVLAPRDFFSAVTAAANTPNLIAEIKKASPSAGLIRPDFDPVAIARIYQDNGASALSVLTDRTYFSGDLSYIERVRNAVTLPVLRKDFIIDEYQILESRVAGADAVLLIAGILEPNEIETYIAVAFELGMSSLVEVHDLDQLNAVRGAVDPAHRALLGINNRDLHRQTTDLHTARRLAAELPAQTPFVSESGIKTRADVQFLERAGASALLIGETFMRAEDIGSKVRELMGRDSD